MNFDEAMAKVKKRIGADCRVTKVETKPCGWMFHYQEIDWKNQKSLGRGPIFVDVFGEMFHASSFLGEDVFYREWEVLYSEYKSELWKSDEPTILSEEEVLGTMRVINTILMYAIKDKASEISIKSLPNFFHFIVRYLIDDEWHDQMKSHNYALIAFRLKEMAKIEPRDKHASPAPQNGSFDVTMKGENYHVFVTSTLTKNGEELHLKLQLET